MYVYPKRTVSISNDVDIVFVTSSGGTYGFKSRRKFPTVEFFFFFFAFMLCLDILCSFSIRPCPCPFSSDGGSESDNEEART